MNSYIVLKLKSKRLLDEIINKKINIIYIKYLNNEILIKIKYNDYKRLIKNNSNKQIEINKYAGKRKAKDLILKYKIPIICFILGTILLLFLSQHIFYINIDTYNNELKKEIEYSLEKNNIKKYSLKRSYKKLEKVKKRIKENNENIEWIELKNDGVVLNVKVIEKKEKYNNQNINNYYTDIIAKKSGYIRKIIATSGEVLKNTDDYVEKGETIISGNIIKNDEIVAKTKSKGLIYAEVWYIKKLSKNLNSTVLEKSGYSRKKLIINVNNKKINLLNIKIKDRNTNKKILFKTSIFSLIEKTETEYEKKNKKYTDEEAIIILKNKAKKDILKTLDKTEYITSQKTLKKYKENDKISIEVLFKVYEEIGQTVKAKENIEKEE